MSGGVLMDDIEEALPHAQKAIRKLTEDNHIATVTRQVDKKLIVFYRPKGWFLAMCCGLQSLLNHVLS